MLVAALQFTFTRQQNGETIIADVMPSGIQFARVLSIIGFIASLLSLGTTAALVCLYTRKPSAWQYRHWLRRLSILSGAWCHWCGCPQCLGIASPTSWLQHRAGGCGRGCVVCSGSGPSAQYLNELRDRLRLWRHPLGPLPIL
jgi:hypothetical protein